MDYECESNRGVDLHDEDSQEEGAADEVEVCHSGLIQPEDLPEYLQSLMAHASEGL